MCVYMCMYMHVYMRIHLVPLVEISRRVQQNHFAFVGLGDRHDEVCLAVVLVERRQRVTTKEVEIQRRGCECRDGTGVYHVL